MAALALSGLAVCAQAQPVLLGGLMELALNSHPTVLQARSQAQAAGFELESAKWGRYPSVSTEIRSDSAYMQSLAKVEQPVWAGGRIDARIALGQANELAAQSGVADAQLTALTQVSTAFFESLRLKDRILKADDSIREHRRLLEMIQRRTQAMVSPPSDETLAQARLQQALTERLQFQRQLESSTNQLTQWVGNVSGELRAPRSLPHVRQGSASAAVEQALTVSGLRRKLLAQVESTQAQIDLAKSQRFPTVVAGVQHVLQGPSTDRTRAYVALQFQPGAGLSVVSGIQGAIAKKDAAQQELLALDRSIESQVSTLYGEIEVLRSQLTPAELLAEQVSELVDSYLRQYQVGRKNWLDVLNAQKEKTQALYNLTDVRYTLLLAQVRLLLQTGQLHGQNLKSIND